MNKYVKILCVKYVNYLKNNIGGVIMSGWIKLYRELKDKAIWQKCTPEHKTILITLLMIVNYKPNQWEWQGKKFTVEKGQMITSLDSIVKESGKGITIQNVRSALKKFEKLGFLTNKSTKTGRLVTILNWHTYQDSEEDSNKDTNKELTKNQQRSNKELTPNKKDKNVKNDKKNTYGEFKNVKLKDSEIEKLKADFGNEEELITFLDEYIEMKGYKAKNHYLAIRKWVVDAVKEDKIKKNKLDDKTVINHYSGHQANFDQRSFQAGEYDKYIYDVTKELKK